jgi:uncharacterized lipoprotein YmbA
VRPDPRFKREAIALALVFFLAACAAREPLPQFYLLAPPGPGGNRSHSGPTVYVQRVVVPAYLARNSLATVRAGNQVDYAGSARWAEPLDQGIARMVAEGLNRVARVQATSFTPNAPPPADYTYSVEIQLHRFEGTDTGQVILAGRYEVLPANGTDPIASRSFDVRRTGWQPGDYPGLARVLSEELMDVSRAIARSL